MCGLCGALGVEHHWSASRPDGQSADAALRRRERAERVRHVNALLRPVRVTVREWRGSAYVVSSPTGRSEIADHLGEVWAAVERLRGAPFDPLLRATDEAATSATVARTGAHR